MPSFTFGILGENHRKMVQKQRKINMIKCKDCKKKFDLQEIIEAGQYEKIAGILIYECPHCLTEQTSRE